jgi:hypothetical protein
MADYFTNFSFIINLPNREAQDYALNLAIEGGSGFQGAELPEDFPTELENVTEDWCFETDPDPSEGKPALWLHSSNGGIDAVCAFIQHLLQKFDPQGRVTFEWSNDCSKPRTDAFGGGAALITAKKIESMTTCEWTRKHAA